MGLFPSIYQSPCYSHWCCAPLDDPFPPSDDVTSSSDDVTIPSSHTSCEDSSDITTDDEAIPEVESEKFMVQQTVKQFKRSTDESFSFPLLQCYVFELRSWLLFLFSFTLLLLCRVVKANLTVIYIYITVLMITT